MPHIAQVRGCCTLYKARLDSVALPDGPNVGPDKKFFCRQTLRDLFTPDAIKELLNCACDRCQQCREELGLHDKLIKAAVDRIAQVGNERSRKHVSSGMYHVALGLLLYADLPALTLKLAHQRCDDTEFSRLLDTLNDEQLRDRFWPNAAHVTRELAQYFAKTIRSSRFHFYVPYLEVREYVEYEESVILPFLSEEKIGVQDSDGNVQSEGSFGDIYAFSLLDEHHNFETQWQSSSAFVRKELRGPHSSLIFRAEHRNLDYVSRIKDAHIVPVLKAYKHGNKCNIIFPRAKTNLDHYFRDARYGATEAARGSTLATHPFWAQADGLARALHKILNYEADDERFLYGYHFDLKPSNILVFPDGRFMISDFGQAHFKEAQASGSKTTEHGATESYAPPEYDRSPLTRKYDIWSLGCIFLEIATYVVVGQDGVLELDRRRAPYPQNATKVNDRFVECDNTAEGVWRLKPLVAGWLDHLLEMTPDSCKQFVAKFLTLIKRMLTIDVDKRCDSPYLCWTLSEIINRRKLSVASVHNDSHDQDRYLDSDLLAPRIESLKYHYLGSWRSASVRLACTGDQLYLFTLRRRVEAWDKVLLGDVRFLKLVPLYALRDESKPKFAGSSLYLLDQSASGSRPLPCDRFYSDNPTDIRNFQEALLGQKVMHHAEAATVSIQQQSAKPPFFSVFSKHREATHSSGITDEIRPIVQLWSDGYRTVKTADQQTHGLDVSHGQFHPTLHRLMVISQAEIHVIRIDDNVRMAKDTEEDVSHHVCRLQPTTKERAGATFQCLTICKTSNSALAAVPLSSQSLLIDEERNGHPVTNISITFQTLETRKAFKEMYKKLKYKWETQQRRFAQAQERNEVGLKLGYAPN